MPWVEIRGQNKVSGKEPAPMLMPEASIAYITVNRDLYVVVMLNNGESITTNQTIADIKRGIETETFNHTIANNGSYLNWRARNRD